MNHASKKTMDDTRRRLLWSLAAVPAGAMFCSLPGLALSAAPAPDAKRFVLVILRGAMDGIAAVAPYGDPALAELRGPLLSSAGELHKLDSFFGLHPAFNNLYAMYQQGELLPCHAIATPYRQRSHFDAQNVLEIGTALPDVGASGWLNRSVQALENSNPAMAIGQSIPPVLLGSADVGSWSPARFPEPSANTMERLQALYGRDPFLGTRLEQALLANGLIGGTMSTARAGAQDFHMLIDTAAKFMAQETGPAITVLEKSGWDTHANQGGTEGQLARQFTQLDDGLAKLKQGLGTYWQHTVVAVVTEFGRTVAVNGTQGTDHGTASAAFLLGGAVKGGRVHGTWPGLASGNLYEGRDLMPTADMRSLFKSVLREHLAISADTIEALIFPDSSAAGYIQGLVREKS